MAKIVLDGVAREVVVERAGDGLVVVVEGRRHNVTAPTTLEGSLSFFIENSTHVAFVSNNINGMQISLAGRTYLRPDMRVDTDTPAASASGSRDGKVQAPMPGGIIALYVSEGEHVTAGQPLVVLESMKMHNEITSPANGVVRRVHIKVGEQVSFGHVLVEVGADAEK